MLSHRSLVVALALAAPAAAPLAARADTYSLTTYTGQLFSSPNIKPPFSGIFTGGEAITGNFVIDNTTRPGAGSGLVNVFTDLYPDAALIPPATMFSFQLGSLSFTAADNLDSLLFGGPGIQYNNGVFNGLEFVTDFNFSGATYQLRIDGPALTVFLVGANGFVTGSRLMGGSINTGDSATTPFDPNAISPPNGGVPEPASWALMIVGIGGVGAVLRRNRRARAAVA